MNITSQLKCHIGKRFDPCVNLLFDFVVYKMENRTLFDVINGHVMMPVLRNIELKLKGKCLYAAGMRC